MITFNKDTKFRIKKYWSCNSGCWLYMPQYNVLKWAWFKTQEIWFDFGNFGYMSEKDAMDVINRAKNDIINSDKTEYIYVE